MLIFNNLNDYPWSCGLVLLFSDENKHLVTTFKLLLQEDTSSIQNHNTSFDWTPGES